MVNIVEFPNEEVKRGEDSQEDASAHDVDFPMPTVQDLAKARADESSADDLLLQAQPRSGNSPAVVPDNYSDGEDADHRGAEERKE